MSPKAPKPQGPEALFQGRLRRTTLEPGVRTRPRRRGPKAQAEGRSEPESSVKRHERTVEERWWRGAVNHQPKPTVVVSVGNSTTQETRNARLVGYGRCAGPTVAPWGRTPHQRHARKKQERKTCNSDWPQRTRGQEAWWRATEPEGSPESRSKGLEARMAPKGPAKKNAEELHESDTAHEATAKQRNEPEGSLPLSAVACFWSLCCRGNLSYMPEGIAARHRRRQRRAGLGQGAGAGNKAHGAPREEPPAKPSWATQDGPQRGPRGRREGRAGGQATNRPTAQKPTTTDPTTATATAPTAMAQAKANPASCCKCCSLADPGGTGTPDARRTRRELTPRGPEEQMAPRGRAKRRAENPNAGSGPEGPGSGGWWASKLGRAAPHQWGKVGGWRCHRAKAQAPCACSACCACC